MPEETNGPRSGRGASLQQHCNISRSVGVLRERVSLEVKQSAAIQPWDYEHPKAADFNRRRQQNSATDGPDLGHDGNGRIFHRCSHANSALVNALSRPPRMSNRQIPISIGLKVPAAQLPPT